MFAGVATSVAGSTKDTSSFGHQGNQQPLSLKTPGEGDVAMHNPHPRRNCCCTTLAQKLPLPSTLDMSGTPKHQLLYTCLLSRLLQHHKPLYLRLQSHSHSEQSAPQTSEPWLLGICPFSRLKLHRHSASTLT